MKRSVTIAKLHGVRVTGADLNYEGSIALDPDHCDLVGLLPLEFVEIWNKTTRARISTHTSSAANRAPAAACSTVPPHAPVK